MSKLKTALAAALAAALPATVSPPAAAVELPEGTSLVCEVVAHDTDRTSFTGALSAPEVLTLECQVAPLSMFAAGAVRIDNRVTGSGPALEPGLRGAPLILPFPEFPDCCEMRLQGTSLPVECSKVSMEYCGQPYHPTDWNSPTSSEPVRFGLMDDRDGGIVIGDGEWRLPVVSVPVQ